MRISGKCLNRRSQTNIWHSLDEIHLLEHRQRPTQEIKTTIKIKQLALALSLSHMNSKLYRAQRAMSQNLPHTTNNECEAFISYQTYCVFQNIFNLKILIQVIIFYHQYI